MDRKGKINAIRKFVRFFVVRINFKKFRFSNAQQKKNEIRQTRRKMRGWQIVLNS